MSRVFLTNLYLEKAWVFLPAGLLVLSLVALLCMFHKYRKTKQFYQNELQKRTADLKNEIEKANAAVVAKSGFLSRMSHEIRTPLNAIIGMAQIAQNTPDKVKSEDCMIKLVDSTKHLLGIINDILDFSKIESAKLVLEEKPFGLCHDIEFVVSMFKDRAREKTIDLRVQLESIEHDHITTDMLRLNQVLINLLSNAIKFTDPGGTVCLVVSEMAHLNGESVYGFTVRDNGVGIEPEQAKKLFTPFTQANTGVTRIFGGTGLGLSISQSIVKMMGGEIEIETSPGQGSAFQFTIRIPAEKGVVEPQGGKVPAVAPGWLRGKRILIVDDIEINREVAAALLEDSGALIEMAANGKEAFDAFCASSPHWFDFILMDMQMPVMDGCAATIEIRGSARADAHDVKIIAMTASVLPEDTERAYSAGMNGYVIKPVELDQMYKALKELQ